MKKYLITSLVLPLLLWRQPMWAQDTLRPVFDKKFNVGCYFTNGWTGIQEGPLPKEYKFKPSVGGGAQAEYYFKNIVGLGVGVAYQQRGAIILNQDVYKALGDPDSTNRERLRIHALEFPIYLAIHSPSYRQKVRLFASAGVIYSLNQRTQKIFHSIEDGFHDIQFPTSDYYKKDLLYNIQFGIDIDINRVSVFQVQYFLQQGTKNIYNPQGSYQGFYGENRAHGIKLCFMY